MKRILTMCVVLVCAAALLAWSLPATLAEPAAPQMPTPGPEHKRLGYWAGTWTGSAEVKESPFGPAGTVTMLETNEWHPGGYFLVSRTKEKGPMGDSQGVAIMGYDREDQVYTYYAVSSVGYSVFAKGKVEGDTWTWHSESKMAGQVMHTRFIAKELPPDKYSYNFATSMDGGKTWTQVMEGVSTRMFK